MKVKKVCTHLQPLVAVVLLLRVKKLLTTRQEREALGFQCAALRDLRVQESFPTFPLSRLNLSPNTIGERLPRRRLKRTAIIIINIYFCNMCEKEKNEEGMNEIFALFIGQYLFIHTQGDQESRATCGRGSRHPLPNSASPRTLLRLLM